jgi:ligand-binding sensor protein
VGVVLCGQIQSNEEKKTNGLTKKKSLQLQHQEEIDEEVTSWLQ